LTEKLSRKSTEEKIKTAMDRSVKPSASLTLLKRYEGSAKKLLTVLYNPKLRNSENTSKKTKLTVTATIQIP
jgi:hypothetical protein